MTKFHDWPSLQPDLLAGGTPCQAFSVAGLREGLNDPRGNLTLTFLAVAKRYMPRWIVWENVPGVLSDRTNAFGQFLAGLAQLGYGWSYRVLDAQFFGLAQRRKRVFVVAYLGDWTRAASVLFEREGLRWNPPPGREAWKDIVGTLGARTSGGGGLGTDFDLAGGVQASANGRHPVGVKWPAEVASTLNAHYGDKWGLEDQHALGGASLFVPSTSATVSSKWAKGRGGYTGQNECDNAVLVPAQDPAYPLAACPASHTSHGESQCNYAVAFTRKDHGADVGPVSPTLRSMGHTGSHPNGGGQVAVCFQESQTGRREYANAGRLRANGPGHDPVGTRLRIGLSVRRLTPKECERLQGFPDGYTDIRYKNKPAPDGPRYKALGNSMAVPVMRWIGARIQQSEWPDLVF